MTPRQMYKAAWILRFAVHTTGGDSRLDADCAGSYADQMLTEDAAHERKEAESAEITTGALKDLGDEVAALRRERDQYHDDHMQEMANNEEACRLLHEAMQSFGFCDAELTNRLHEFLIRMNVIEDKGFVQFKPRAVTAPPRVNECHAILRAEVRAIENDMHLVGLHEQRRRLLQAVAYCEQAVQAEKGRTDEAH